MRIILLTGISGSGKSVGLNALEDAGYFCVDNLPPSLLRSLVETRSKEGDGNTLAVAVDARSADSLAGLPDDVRWLKEQGHDLKVLFLTAKTESLITRFSETRRSHPLSHRVSSTLGTQPTLVECIHAEREMLAPIEKLGHLIDTSGASANKLRTWIRELVASDRAALTLLFESFAYKYGIPLDADLVFDVRVLPNPYYDPLLRPYTGRDQPVIEFLDMQAEAADLLADIRNFVDKWLPAFEKDNRSYLTVAIGCTGGQHRSVYMTELLARHFAGKARVLLRHRELD
ncbi:MAG: rapZ [Paucimonas sp.]|nr:rapZ [Paucimonas sp.]